MDHASEQPLGKLWRKAAERALKGEPAESLTQHTLDGLAIAPLCGPGPSPRLAPLARAGSDGAIWDIRASVEHPDPAPANALVLEALEGGAGSGCSTDARMSAVAMLIS